MKRLFLIAMFLFIGAESAYAGCTIKCITRNPFTGKCVVKTKVCDIGSPGDWLEQSEKEVKNFAQNIQSEWHNVYRSSLPEEIRIVLNSRPFTIIGASLGGLEGAALGTVLDEAIQRIGFTFKKAKEVKQGAPAWKQDIIDQGTAEVVVTEGEIATSGQASNQHLADEIQGHFDTFLTCIGSAAAIDQGWECLYTLQDALTGLERQARRR